MCEYLSSTATTDTPADAAQEGSTRLETTLTVSAELADPAASLAMRLSTLRLTSGGRIDYGEISYDAKGNATCPVGFDCSQYEPSVNGEPNPAAVAAFTELVEGVNADRCMFTGALIPR